MNNKNIHIISLFMDLYYVAKSLGSLETQRVFIPTDVLKRSSIPKQITEAEDWVKSASEKLRILLQIGDQENG